MIEFHSQNEFELMHELAIKSWIAKVVQDENFELGQVDYVFCTDEYLHGINVQFLEHDTYTDIISFDYTMGREVSGEIYVSTERVKENAETYNVSFENELHRVLVHGILHFCGYKDKSEKEASEMRLKEDLSLDKLVIG